MNPACHRRGGRFENRASNRAPAASSARPGVRRRAVNLSPRPPRTLLSRPQMDFQNRGIWGQFATLFSSFSGSFLAHFDVPARLQQKLKKRVFRPRVRARIWRTRPHFVVAFACESPPMPRSAPAASASTRLNLCGPSGSPAAMGDEAPRAGPFPQGFDGERSTPSTKPPR
jgi:hypothetical protein